jgi:hypothetical protein
MPSYRKFLVILLISSRVTTFATRAYTLKLHATISRQASRASTCLPLRPKPRYGLVAQSPRTTTVAHPPYPSTTSMTPSAVGKAAQRSCRCLIRLPLSSETHPGLEPLCHSKPSAHLIPPVFRVLPLTGVQIRHGRYGEPDTDERQVGELSCRAHFHTYGRDTFVMAMEPCVRACMHRADVYRIIVCIYYACMRINHTLLTS